MSGCLHALAGLIPESDCVLCHRPSSDVLCDTCAGDIDAFDICGCRGNLLRNPKIQRALPDLSIHTLAAVGVYQWPLDKLISEFKFQRRFCCGKALATVFSRHWRAYLTLPEAIVPVPLHWRRTVQRRFNQSAELAKHLCSEFNCQLDTDLCRRLRATDSQKALSAAARRRNLRDAFDSAHCPYRHIAIVDDVVTTGSTIRALTSTIHRQRPDCRIDVWTMAIALPDSDKTG